MKKDLISPYSFPGIKKELLNKKKYSYVFSQSELKLTREDVMNIISKETGLSADMIFSRSREIGCVDARNIYYKILNLGFKCNYSQIAREMKRDHTTILSAIKKFNNHYKNEEDFREVTDRIFKRVGTKLDIDKVLK